MPYKAVLFDLDGTLLDTIEDIGDGAMNFIIRALPEDKRIDTIIRPCLGHVPCRSALGFQIS